MKTIPVAFIAALLTSLLSASPTSAADVDHRIATAVESGTFAGARFRLPLGGGGKAKPRLALTLAPMLRSKTADGRNGLSFGDGLGFGVTGRDPLSLSIAGKPLNAFTSRIATIDKTHATGISTLGYVAIGVGVVVAVVLVGTAACQETNCLNSD